MSHDQTTHTQDHVERARQIADALDSQDMEQTLHEQFYAEWKAWEAEDPTRTMNAFDRAIGRGRNYTGRIVRAVTGAAARSDDPFDSQGRDQRRVKQILREKPQEVAPEIAKAMEDPDVREAVAKHMAPSAARDLGERANRDHPAHRKLDAPLGVPEPKANYETRMSGPLVRLHDAISYFVQTHEQYSDGASDEELESVRDQLAGELARAQAAIADWSMR